MTQNVIDRTGIADLATEVLSTIFSLVVDVPFLHPTFPSDSTAAAQDLLSITHVNTRFREVSVQDPRLWTTIPPINCLHPDHLKVMLKRSRPLPFSLAILEGEDMPLGASTWEPIIGEKKRIGLLYVEVDEEYAGTLSRGFLTSEAPSLKHCIVAFRGQRNVCLKYDGAPGRHRLPFDGYAPHLATLELVNCYIPPQYFKFPNSISSISVHSYTSPSNGHMGMPDGLRVWDSNWKSLRILKLVNCFYPFHSDDLSADNVLELGCLETLILSLPYDLCKILADRLVYPDECSCTITSLFPPKLNLLDARAAVIAVSSFVPEAQFIGCRLSLEPGRPSVYLHREAGGDVTVSFDLQDSEAVLPIAPKAYTRTAVDHFCLALWRSLGAVLQARFETVKQIHITFPSAFQSTTPWYLMHTLPFLPQVHAASFSPPTIYASSAFVHVFSKAFPRLQLLLLKLEGHSQQTLSGLTDLLTRRDLHGCGVEEMVFVVAPSLPLPLRVNESAKQLVLPSSVWDIPDRLRIRWIDKCQ